MNENAERTDFENQLADLLHARVATKEVRPNLDAVTSTSTVEPPAKTPSTKAWWLAAAALLIIGGIGISRLASDPDRAIATEAAAGGDTGAPPTDVDTTELLVWLKSDATSAEIEAMAGLLINSPVIEEIEVQGDDGSLGAFADHFAEVADGVQLIDPEIRPRAFRVLTTNPGDVGDLVTGVDGLDGVENVG